MRLLILLSSILLLCGTAAAQIPDPVVITEGSGGFPFSLNDDDGFGFEKVIPIGDLDGNGVTEILVSADRDDDGGFNSGAFYVLFLDEQGHVIDATKTSWDPGQWPHLTIESEQKIGARKEVYRDLDDDGIPEILISHRTRVSVLYLNPDGTLRRTELFRRFSGTGSRVVNIAVLRPSSTDLQSEIAISYDDGRLSWMTLFSRDETASFAVEANPGQGGPSPELQIDRRTGWGHSLVNLGDVNGDGHDDLGIGSDAFDLDDDNFSTWGALWVVFLKPVTGSIPAGLVSLADLTAGSTVIRTITGQMRDVAGPNNKFGGSLAALGDLDGNGVTEVAVPTHPNDGTWILFLDNQGQIDWKGWIPTGPGFFANNPIGAVSNIGDLNGDGVPELAIRTRTPEGKEAITITFELAALAPEIRTEREQVALGGLPVPIAAEIRGTIEVQEAKVSFRPAGSATFFETDLSKMGFSDFEAEIPAFFLGNGGFEYFITTDEPVGRFPREGVVSVPTRHQEGFSLPTRELTGPRYELITVPLESDSTDALATFEDDLGPYDITEWRFFELDKGNWRELSEAAINLEPGRAYALNRGDGGRVVDSFAGQTVRTDQTYPIIVGNGWNLVGNPFAFDIPLERLSFASGEPVELWAYDSTWSIETRAMEMFAGYAIKVDERDTLWVNPDLSENVGGRTSNVEQPARRSSDERGAETGRPPTAERKAELEAMMGKLGNDGAIGSRDLRHPTFDFRLLAYPNPFSRDLTITFELDEEAHVALEAFDLLGRRVTTLIDAQRSAGMQSIKWTALKDGLKLADGLYILQLTAGETRVTTSISLAR